MVRPDECVSVRRTFTFNATDWTSTEDIRIIAWLQEPGPPDPSEGKLKEVYQAAVMAWPFPGPYTPVCGDFDGDGDVDLGDFATFALCYAGAAVTTPPAGCSADEFEAADCEGDGDVDLGDFATFADNFTG